MLYLPNHEGIVLNFFKHVQTRKAISPTEPIIDFKKERIVLKNADFLWVCKAGDVKLINVA